VIWVTRLDGTELAVNSDLILTIESTPDTVLALTNGERLLVKQTVPEIMERVVAFRRQIALGPAVAPAKG
jgi:flagellar protein FlbD